MVSNDNDDAATTKGEDPSSPPMKVVQRENKGDGVCMCVRGVREGGKIGGNLQGHARGYLSVKDRALDMNSPERCSLTMVLPR